MTLALICIQTKKGGERTHPWGDWWKIKGHQIKRHWLSLFETCQLKSTSQQTNPGSVLWMLVNPSANVRWSWGEVNASRWTRTILSWVPVASSTHLPALMTKLEWIQFCLLFYNLLKGFHNKRRKCHRPTVIVSLSKIKAPILHHHWWTLWRWSDFTKMKEKMSDNVSAQFPSPEEFKNLVLIYVSLRRAGIKVVIRKMPGH